MGCRRVRFGLVGFGLFGKHHAQAISRSRGAELASIAVKSPASRQAARDAFPQVAVHADYRQMIAQEDLEVVDIAAPNHLHHEIALAALEADRHVLLEKPMALRLRDCDQLLDAARRGQRLLAINHELRLSSLWGRVKSLLEQGVIGRPQYALLELSRFPYRQGSEGWRWDVDRVGNWILEEPVHFFDLARWYMAPCGEPMSIYARANSRHAQQQLRDNFSATVNFGDGGFAVISQTLSAFEHHVTAKIAGTEGAIWSRWSAPDARSPRPTYSLRYGLGDKIEQVEGLQPTGELLELAEQIEAMAASVRDGAPLPCSGADGRWSTLLCLAAQQSVERGEVVDLAAFQGES